MRISVPEDAKFIVGYYRISKKDYQRPPTDYLYAFMTNSRADPCENSNDFGVEAVIFAYVARLPILKVLATHPSFYIK